MIGIVKGTGSCLPEREIDNNELACVMDTNDEWIRERTGIARRRVASEETTVSMAVRAAERALESAGVAAADLDLILVSTVSSDTILPSTACAVQAQIGAFQAACFDLNAACTGFLFALNTAQAYFHGGMVQKALVIGAESLSRLVDWQDRGTAILFGDGAGAAVLVAGEGDLPAMVMHSNGAKGGALTCKSPFGRGGIWSPASLPEAVFREDAGKTGDFRIHMDGQTVFRFAVGEVPRCILELLEKCGREVGEIDLFLLHQANARIVEAIARRIRADIGRFPMNLAEYGNTSSASIPILMDELYRSGRLRKGMKLVIAGFGAGLSWGASYMEWNG